MKTWSKESFVIVITAVIAFFVASFAFLIAPGYEKNIKIGCGVVMLATTAYILIRKKK